MKLKNSISCLEFPNNKLISQDEVDLDVSNLKKLKKKLAIIEEKEKKNKVEKKTIKRKAKFRKKINTVSKTDEMSHTHTTTSKILKSKETENKENERATESKESSNTGDQLKHIEETQNDREEEIDDKSSESDKQHDKNFRILSKAVNFKKEICNVCSRNSRMILTLMIAVPSII